ncbi:hypothetical protein BOX15_Mlig033043g1 [Macrostomum lignano]|uniref:RRM domain-containing protein n=1 Tax=Macrostomum lignano TaxID=282301 RepID=A0A267HA60_9PLAT|nr:hypothetical protein BOX15_Mlig033043g1 [Macrostomum lignano]
MTLQRSSSESSSMSSASSSSSANSAALSSIAEATNNSSTVAAMAAAAACWEGNGNSGSLMLPTQHPPNQMPIQHHLAPDADGNEPGKLFIGGLSQATTEASLRTHFSRFGQLDSAVVMMDSVSGRSRGFGFVKFKDPACAAAALQQHQGPDEQQCLDGKTIDVKQSNVRVRGSRAALTRHLKVFVGGVPPEADAQLVRAQFSQYGRVLDVNLMPDPARQRHRGFAFVTFEDERVVQRLVQVHFVELAGRLVEVKAMKPPSAAVLSNAQPPTLGQQHPQQFLLPPLQQQQHQQQSLLLMQQAAPLSCQLHQQQLNPQQRQQLALLQHQQLQLQQQQQQQQAFITAGSGGAGGAGGALPLLANTCSWQPAVAFDPGLAWAAAAAWADPHQQQQQPQQQQQQTQQQLPQQTQQPQQSYNQHHHLSFVEPTAACWLSQPLLAATTAPWPPTTAGLLPLQSFARQQQQAQTQSQQQQQQQTQQQNTQQQPQPLSVVTGHDANSTAPWHFIPVGSGIVGDKELPLPIGSGIPGQHAQSSQSAILTSQHSVPQQQPPPPPIQQQQQRSQQQQQQQQQQQPDPQLILQSRAAGDFGRNN